MSFAADVKQELCKCAMDEKEKNKAECYGMMLFAKKFSHTIISMTTENNHAAQRFVDLTSQIFLPVIEKRSYIKDKKTAKKLYILSIPDSGDCGRIFESFGHNKTDINLRINRANMEADYSVADFLRGVFLCCGSVNDPSKNYHLEFCVPYKTLCKDLCTILEEITETEPIKPKIIERNGVFVAYVKGSEQIADLLTYMGAFHSSMSIMGTKAMKQVRNAVNRKTNSEIANINKTAAASVKQVNAIKKIKKRKQFSALSDELKEIAEVRLENPELSLRDLGQLLNPPISRSGVNHRITKLLEIAENLS